MEDTTYNGWKNYETWCVKLWMDNDQGSQEYWQERAQEACDADWTPAYASQTHRQHARYMLAAELKDEHEEAAGDRLSGASAGVFSDLLGAALSEVDWYEIAESLLDDVETTDSTESEISDHA